MTPGKMLDQYCKPPKTSFERGDKVKTVIGKIVTIKYRFSRGLRWYYEVEEGGCWREDSLIEKVNQLNEI